MSTQPPCYRCIASTLLASLQDVLVVNCQGNGGVPHSWALKQSNCHIHATSIIVIALQI